MYARQQLVEKNAQRVDVGARVDDSAGHLLRRGVGRRADEASCSRLQSAVGQWVRDRLGEPEVEDPRLRPAVLARDEDVGWLEVAMEDALLVCVLHPGADLDEELEPLPDAEAVAVAEADRGLAVHELHDEVGTTRVGGARVEDPGDRGVIHHREGLPLRLEAGEQLTRVHAELDHLESDATVQVLELLGLPDFSHAAFPEPPQELVRADPPPVLEGR